MESIEQDPLANFTYAIKASETRRQYVAKLKAFFDFIELNGSFEEQASEFIKRARHDSSWALASLIKFLTYQKERAERKEITEGTVKNYYKPAKLFCDMNDIVLNWKRIHRGLPKGSRSANDRAPTLEELRKICDYPDRRIRPIIYLMTSSGIRLGAWDWLKWGNIQPVTSNKDVVAAKMIIYPGSPDEYLTFITPEAYSAIKSWIDYREECGERITKDSWVMRDLWQTEFAMRGQASFPKKLQGLGIKRLVERALWAQGVRKKLDAGQSRHEFKADHGFRKFFKTRAEQVMKPINVEWLMGHSTGVSDSYYRPTEQELLADYLKAVPLLQISETAQVQQEFAEAEKAWKGQFAEMKSLVEKMQTQLNSLTAAVVSAKIAVLQG